MDLNTFFGQINSNYASNNNVSNTVEEGNKNTMANEPSSNNGNQQLSSIVDDTPAILLEQLAYIDTFMPQIEEDLITTHNNSNNNNNNNTDHHLLQNDINKSSDLLNPLNDFMTNALDDRLAEELKIFADESFIFPDEEKPEYHDNDNNANYNNNNNSNNNSNFLNINNHSSNNDILSNSYQRQQARKDIRGKNFKAPFENDDNKAFLKRHNNNTNTNRAGSPLHQEIHPLSFDYISGSNNLQNNTNNTNQQSQNPSYTPSVHSFHSNSASNSIISLPQQTIADQIKQKPTQDLNMLLPSDLQRRYSTILQRLILEKDEKWGNFSKEEAALLLLFKEHFLPQLPVNLLQYDQFQDLAVVEAELYKVLSMGLNQSEVKQPNTVVNDNASKTVDESIGVKRPSSTQEDDLENQVKKLIKISEKLQKKITSLEVENKMLRNLLSKDE